MEILSRALEDARKDLLDKHSRVVTKSSRAYLDDWVRYASIDPVAHAVDSSMDSHGLSDDSIRKEMYASLKFRLLAGILTAPVSFPDPEGGICDKMIYDGEKNEFRCEVSGNQEQADAYHEVFGHSYLCPFNEQNQPAEEEDREGTQLDKLLSEGESLDSALRILGFN